MFIIQNIIPDFTTSFMLVSKDIFTRPWILLTSMFLHGSLNHLLFNMYALFMFGTLIEQRIGTKRFIIIYLVSGLLAAFIPTYEAALGASGAIMGIIGMTIMLFPDMKVLLFFILPMSMRTAGIIFALLDLFGMFSPVSSGIAHFAHLVGLATGLAYGFYLIRKKKQFQKKFTGPKVTVIKPNGYGKENINMSKEEMEEYLKYGRL